jgi:hypothetical protein
MTCDTAQMLVDRFWELVDLARSDALTTERRFDLEAVAAALQNRLQELPLEQIIEFSECYDMVRDRLRQWEMCAAAYVVSDYISDDTFENFQGGVIALGRTVYNEIVENPDALAGHPVVVDIAAGRLDRSALMDDGIQSAAVYAYAARCDGDHEAFWEALAARPAHPASEPTNQPAWNGRFGEPGDAARIPLRLPRLAAMFNEAVKQW